MLDMLLFDELGQSTSELILQLDFIVSIMTKSDKLFEGVLLIVNMDPLQLQPIHISTMNKQIDSQCQ
jgi:hypothetical protein